MRTKYEVRSTKYEVRSTKYEVRSSTNYFKFNLYIIYLYLYTKYNKKFFLFKARRHAHKNKEMFIIFDPKF